MSRSFKKTPIYKDGGYQSNGKRIANRKVRRAPNDTFSTGKRKLYKKIYKPYPLETAFRPRRAFSMISRMRFRLSLSLILSQ